MQITLYPKRLLLTAGFIVVLSGMLSIATDTSRAGILGIVGLLAYCVFEVFFTVNPAAWWRDR